MGKGFNLQFKYSTSKAKSSYGYNVITLYVNGEKVARHCGGGYDMFSSVIGDWMTKQFNEELKKLPSKEHYGVFHYDKEINKRVPHSGANTETFVDGACGTSTDILTAIGYNFERVVEDVYRVVKA
jgi:hypothetical protein